MSQSFCVVGSQWKLTPAILMSPVLVLQEKRAAEKFNASAEGKKLQDAVAQEGVALSEQVRPMH